MKHIHSMDYYCTTTRASLVAQMVMNLPAMQETWVRSLGQEDTLEKGMAIHSRILAWREVHGQRNPKVTVHGVTKSQTRQLLNTYTHTQVI